MWNYEKRLQYPVKIKRTDAKIAKVIITQFGGPDGELAASMRYLSQRYDMPYREVAGLLTDIGRVGLECNPVDAKSFGCPIPNIHFCGSKLSFSSTRLSG